MESNVKKRIIRCRKVLRPYAYNDVEIITKFKNGRTEKIRCHLGQVEQFLEVNGHILDVPIREQFAEIVEIFTGTKPELLEGCVK